MPSVCPTIPALGSPLCVCVCAQHNRVDLAGVLFANQTNLVTCRFYIYTFMQGWASLALCHLHTMMDWNGIIKGGVNSGWTIWLLSRFKTDWLEADCLISWLSGQMLVDCWMSDQLTVSWSADCLQNSWLSTEQLTVCWLADCLFNSWSADFKLIRLLSIEQQTACWSVVVVFSFFSILYR